MLNLTVIAQKPHLSFNVDLVNSVLEYDDTAKKKKKAFLDK